MASLREIRRRIKSVENIHDITKAMEIISAVRYKKIEARSKKALPYFSKLEKLISRIISEELVLNHPLFEKRPIKKELLIVVTGDRGLCGAFNATILKEMMKYLSENSDKEISVYPIGKVGNSFAVRRGLNIFKEFLNIGYQFSASSIQDRINELIDSYVNGTFDRIQILCTKPSRSGSQGSTLEPFLDLSYLYDLKATDEGESDYIFEPEVKGVLESLIGLYVKQRFFSLLLQSVTAEYFARMVAMKQASDNGKEVIDQLTLERNKVRQAMITREISEIIGGVSALN